MVGMIDSDGGVGVDDVKVSLFTCSFFFFFSSLDQKHGFKWKRWNKRRKQDTLYTHISLPSTEHLKGVYISMFCLGTTCTANPVDSLSYCCNYGLTARGFLFEQFNKWYRKEKRNEEERMMEQIETVKGCKQTPW